MSAIKVLIIDDSALVRKVLTEVLSQAPDIEVVGACMDPIFARERIKSLKPDVLTLDVEMPRMDGITFLRNLMRLHPLPVVMVSSLTERGADVTLQALELGAVDYVTKPQVGVGAGLLEAYADELVAKVRVAARTNVQALSARSAALSRSAVGSIASIKEFAGHYRTTETVIAIGASTGGTEAIKEILQQMPHDAPGIVITQHIPGAFSGPFAARMNSCSRMIVAEAQDGQQVLPGHVYIAPGDRHLEVMRNGARYVCKLSDGEPVNRHKPSVEVLFDSVARHVGPNAIGVMLTGMGRDGADAMLRLRQAGARTLAQDEKSSVVWGMPGEAVRAGAVETQVPLANMAAAILQRVRRLDKQVV